jgi:quercetin dioxygenase-like cupin family protein
MTIRRVVTGHSQQGKAMIASDSQVEAFEVALMPKKQFFSLWGTDETFSYPDDGSMPDFSSYFPPTSGFRFVIQNFPSDAPHPDLSGKSQVQLEAIMAPMLVEVEAKLPGAMATMEPDHPGFHTSDTVDLIYIISGQIILDLDEGNAVTLKAGDTVVQSGTSHAWHNPFVETCKILFVLIGANRKTYIR